MARKTRIEWQNPPDMVYGQVLGNSQLNAKAVYENRPLKGQYTYTPAAGSVLTPGSQTLHVHFTPDLDDYLPAEDDVQVNVQAATLTVTGITANDRVYDGTTTATLNTAAATLSSPVKGDTVTLDTSNAAGTFADKTAASGKTVTVTGLSLGGANAGSYVLAPVTVQASITPAPLTVTGITVQNKEFDGTVAATINPANAALGKVVAGDVVNLNTSGAQAAFSDANTGTGKNVAVSGLTLSGNDAANYTLTPPTLTANITSAQTSPGNNLMTAVKRVLCDPAVNMGVTQLLREASNQVAGKSVTDSKTVVQGALDRIANAFAGTDAVKAVGEPYGGQLRLEIYLDDSVSGKQELVEPQFLQNVDVQLIDANWNLASSTRTDDKDGILFSQVEPGIVSVALPSEIAECALSDNYEVTDAGSTKFIPKTRLTATTTPGFQAQITAGKQTRLKCFVNPATAHVRCFSNLESDPGGCQQGKRYIQSVSVKAMQGDNIVNSGQTGDGGSVTFALRPGWYIFSALEEVGIGGCTYVLASSSPVSAYVGAGQRCSDIFFSYKKKGNEIEVVSEILHPESGDPYEVVKDNFPGMQYLLLRDNDPTFVPQQQTTADGAAIYFQNLTAGAYLLFCQAPATFGTQPVQPVYPHGGRMALTIFGGQTSAVPVLVKFRTGNTAPAVLDGYDRDDTGAAVPGQLVQVTNSAGCVVAAGITDVNGYYSIQIYSADNLTIIVGSQQIAVSKSQIQADMKTVGTPALPSPRRALEGAVQRSELLPAFRD